MTSSRNDRWLLQGVEISGSRIDCRLAGGLIFELGPSLSPLPSEQVLNCGGGALLPGLADHHVHLRALAAARRSIDLRGGPLPGPGQVGDVRPSDQGWLRIVGVGNEITRYDLDKRWPDCPVRAEHRSGAVWTLNTAALARLRGPISREEESSGQFWRSARRLRDLLGPEAGSVGGDELDALGQELLSYGITHLTDATPQLAPDALHIPQRLLSLADSGMGPRKLVLADHQQPDLRRLTEKVARIHDAGRGVAIHAVTAVSLALVLAALDSVGTHPDDRIEHAAVCDDAAAEHLAKLDVTVVTQPSLLARHGSRFAAESERAERALLWRYGGLLRAGVRVVASSDAPYGDANPWVTVHDATRRRSGRVVLQPDERVDAAIALSSMLTDPARPGHAERQIRPGNTADLCLLEAPLAATLKAIRRSPYNPVRATFLAGHCVYLRSEPKY
jgi:predicted amidohydrolase YtcJ